MNEVERELPQCWVWSTFSEICEINPKHPADIFPAEVPVTFVPMAAIDEVTGTIAKPETKTYSEVRKGYTHFSEGDVLFAKITPCMENGKSAIARNLVNGVGFGTTELHVLRPFDGVLSEYVYYYVRQKNFRDQAAANMTGTAGQLRVPSSYVQKAKIPLCPTIEQKRIVAKVQELLVHVQTARQSLEKAPSLFKGFRQSVLVKAFRGELTDRDPNDEPAEKLLERIRQERRKKWEDDLRAKGRDPKKYEFEEPKPVDAKGLLKLPSSWLWVRVDDIAEVRLGRQRSPQNRPKKYPRRYLRAANVVEDEFDLSDVKVMDFKPQEFETYRLRRGDVLLSEGSGTVEQTNRTLGTCAVWDERISDFCFQNTLIRVRSEHLPPRYLLHVFTYARYKGDFARIAKGIGIAHLGALRLSSYCIPLAPSKEQTAIVQRIDSMFRTAKTTESSSEITSRNMERLEQSILAKAFRGELVPQDPNDESASVLLERIRAQRVAVARKRKSQLLWSL